MDKIDTKKILNLFTYLVLLVVPFLKFFSMNLEMFGLMNNYDNINPAIILYISVPFLIFIYIKNIKDKKRKLDLCDYLFYVLIFVGIISVIFSIDKSLAIFGKDFRHEGFLSIMCYYLLFINWKVNGKKEDIKKIIKFIIILGIINSIYALFQMYTNFDFIFKYNDNGKMASGLCGNPNFFGSLMTTILSMVTCMFLVNKKNSLKLVLLIILFFISLINCQSTGPILSYIICLIFFIIFLFIKKYNILKRFLILFIILILTYISIYFININFLSDNKCETCVSSLQTTISNGGNGRIKIWKNSLDMIKDNFIVGIGFDNFYLKYPNPKMESGIKLTITDILSSNSQPKVIYNVVDNAHNIYLHTLVSNGIIGLVPYLLLCLLTFIKGLKSKDELTFILLSGFVVYSIQAFANISVIQVAPIYYIIIGFILSMDNLKKENEK